MVVDTKSKKQEDTLRVLRDYLQKEHINEKHIDFPNEWKLYTMRNVLQQDTTYTTDCGVFVCMYCNFIQNDCKLDFKQEDITNGPEGHPNNLPQPAWRLAELFFWSDMSRSRADLCANSYVISTCFSLLSKLPSCTRYISYVRIERIIHNLLFRLIHNM
jgi:hypothetical protein